MMESKYIILLSIIAMDIFVYSLSIPYFPSVLLEFEGNDNGTIYFGISQSVGNGLAMFSGIITGYLSDKYSRKGAVVASQIFAGFPPYMRHIFWQFLMGPEETTLLGLDRAKQPELNNDGTIKKNQIRANFANKCSII